MNYVNNSSEEKAENIQEQIYACKIHTNICSKFFNFILERTWVLFLF